MADNQAEYDDGDRAPRPRHNGRAGGGFGGGGGGFPGQAAPHTDLPLRILVNSEMVGAIIGRQGNTIRQITQNTRARVDVHRKDSNGATEKAITIYGNPDNCDNACREILDVMTQEAANTNKGYGTVRLASGRPAARFST
ncbi:insulin-like growth factor 2 mRNA-binding protein 3-A [Pollicipes pollicipes]|uniref:insulin-like growth factor 2 mRNA-binding protein 3-A n=1 Tax=Pollicipes pollicipes TaxID=41117 RepID=UPI0018851B77|nr:insulin-like growth factor 2 mRNA-binding protein 3-A [Pollicipes pollicipes]